MLTSDEWDAIAEAHTYMRHRALAMRLSADAATHTTADAQADLLEDHATALASLLHRQGGGHAVVNSALPLIAAALIGAAVAVGALTSI
jgi:hypothetical protein